MGYDLAFITESMGELEGSALLASLNAQLS